MEEQLSYYGGTTVYEYPSKLLRLTLKALDDMLNEAERFFEANQLIQACEKFYKIAEETVKVLAEYYAPKTMKEVRQRLNGKRNPWDISLLYKAVDEIAKNIFSDEEEAKIFRDGWRSAMDLHRDCFHDFLLSKDMIKDAIINVKKMIAISQDTLKAIEEYIISSGTVNYY